MDKHQQRYQSARRVTLVSVLINVLLGIFKILFGWLGHSQALVADGVHSISDLLTDIFVLVAAKAGSQAPDQDHPYGHGRIETFFVILLSVFLILVGLGIAIDAVAIILKKKVNDIPHVIVLVMALISIVLNEGLFRYMRRVGQNIHSNLLLANAWHHRSDAYASFIVLIGAGGAMLGLYFLDAVAAIIVAAMIIKMGIKMAWQSARELVDTGMEETEANAILQVIAELDGVKAVHQFRSRALAGRFFIDVHVQVDSNISVSEGHYIADKVYRRIRDNFPAIKDITIHIDPEDDEAIKPGDALPSRVEVEALLASRCVQFASWSKLLAIRLDYLAGNIYIHLFFPLEVLSHLDQGRILKQEYFNAVADVKYISGITINLQVTN